MTSPANPRPMADVLVAGGGPVGLSAALLCAARGLTVTVLEAQAETAERPGSRAIFLHGASLDILARADLALAQRITEAGLTWRGKHTLWAERTVYRKAYTPVPSDNTSKRRTPFVSLSQQRVEYELRRACRQAGVELVWQAPVGIVDVQPDYIEVDAGQRFRAQFLIGADGARSTVRTAIGSRLHGARTDASFVVVDLAAEPRQAAERVFHYRHPAAGGRNVLMVPFQGGLRVDLQCRPGDDIDALAAAPATWLAALLPFGHRADITWTSQYRFHQLVADRFVDPGHRVLLAGEAAHLFAPFGARGLNSGIADAAAAAIAVSRTGFAATHALTEYQDTRRQAALRNRDASGQALRHLLATGPVTRYRQQAAARIARRWHRAGEWLDRMPYGPRDAGIPGSIY
jgi:3-(3-hydroxy-phenyl)propionate hydroxylase